MNQAKLNFKGKSNLYSDLVVGWITSLLDLVVRLEIRFNNRLEIRFNNRLDGIKMGVIPSVETSNIISSVETFNIISSVETSNIISSVETPNYGLPSSIENILRIMTLNAAGNLSPFGQMLLHFDVKALADNNYKVHTEVDKIEVCDVYGKLVGQSIIKEKGIYLIITGDDERLFNAVTDRWY
ncbi:Hypothetical protein HVR_LOCUS291 [uncultured virus]|nr:Hypothetical protein HVR_LOCUS291 [uncultured virus]